MKKYLHKIAAFVMSIFLLSGCVKQSEWDFGENGVISETDSSAVTSSDTSETSEDSGKADIPDETVPDIQRWDEYNSAEMTKQMGLGWNLGNQLEASVGGVPGETAWGNPTITKELIQAVKAEGFSTVRIPVSYLRKIGNAPDYIIDEQWIDRVQQVVDYVIGCDMTAVINVHDDGYYTVDGGWLKCADSNQEEIRAKFTAVWKQISERFKDYDEHLVFESMNEVFDNTYGNPPVAAYDNLNGYNQIFVDTVRETGGNNQKRWLLIPGWNTNIGYTTEEHGFEIPNDSKCTADGKRLMISVHYYDPYNFTLDENMSTATTQWGQYAVANYDSWGQEDYVKEQFSLLNSRFVKEGYPVVIGEMGVQDKSHVNGDFAKYRRYWYEYIVKTARENGCIPICWDNGWNGEKGFALFDRSTCKVTQPQLIEAMMRAMNKGEYDIPPLSK